jgi:putative endonuclease
MTMKVRAFLKWFRRRKPSPTNDRTLGGWGEDEAARYLQRAGYHINARNWRLHMGEIDIIARKGREVVFVEVKSGSRLSDIGPESRVGARKQQKIRALAQVYLQGEGGKMDSVRFDVISVWREGNETKLQHFENAF